MYRAPLRMPLITGFRMSQNATFVNLIVLFVRSGTGIAAIGNPKFY